MAPGGWGAMYPEPVIFNRTQRQRLSLSRFNAADWGLSGVAILSASRYFRAERPRPFIPFIFGATRRFSAPLLHSADVGAIFNVSKIGRRRLSETTDPIVFRPRSAGTLGPSDANSEPSRRTTFDRYELTAILDLYGRKVASGEWRDYAIDFLRDKAVFSVYRKASEYALYRIEKDLRLARKQGAYSVIAAGGLIMKRGHDLKRVLSVLEDRPGVVRF